MPEGDPHVVILVDHDPTTPEIVQAVRDRSAHGSAHFRVLMTNPAAREAHIVHAGRHDAVAALTTRLPEIVAALERETGVQVIADVSIRHEPFDALEELMLVHPVDEVIFSVARHRLAERLHLDFAHRLAHLGLDVCDATASRSTAGSS